jgi:pimeloyl-ACP methyl ester carboxylesterase
MPSTTLPPAAAELAFGQSRLARSLAVALRVADRFAPRAAARLALHVFFTPLAKTRPRRVAAPWRRTWMRAGSRRIAVLRHAVDAAWPPRPPVLLVHGWAGDATQMLALGDALADAGFEPVLPDLPAHGRSAGWRCNMAEIVQTLRVVQQGCGPLAAIVAHSMGALASLHAMAEGLPADRLVAMAPSSPPAAVLDWFGDTFDLGSGMLSRLRERIESHESMRLDQFETAWFGARVSQPVLVVHDPQDRLAAFANGRALAAALPNATLQVLDGSSHRRMLCDPRTLAAVLTHLGAA